MSAGTKILLRVASAFTAGEKALVNKKAEKL
jgi:hypothetical protein